MYKGMEFVRKIFDKDDNSNEKKDYERDKILYMSRKGPFHLMSILLMNEFQREQLFEWILIPPEQRPSLSIEGCGASQEDFDRQSQEVLNHIFNPKGVSDGKQDNPIPRRTSRKKQP